MVKTSVSGTSIRSQRRSATAGVTRQSGAKKLELKEAIAGQRAATRFDFRPDFVRKERKRAAKPAKLIAYDFETTRIEAGTPRPLYLTAHGAAFSFESRIRNMAHLRDVLRTQFLTDANEGCKFVAWNGNRFDAYFIAAALIRETDLVIRPYLTRSKALRGVRISLKYSATGALLDPQHAPGWEFLDGIAMLGLAGVNLAKFLENFAPEHRKLVGTIDFERETFNPDNPRHCEYAMRDSVGLWHGMQRAQAIMLQTFNAPLAVTMGGVCIKIFAAHIPRDVTISSLTPDLLDLTRTFVMRGGYCYCARRYHGPVWKYDINQAYAAAMREADLPCEGFLRLSGTPADGVRCFIARIEARKPGNKIPFYYRAEIDGRIRSLFATDHIRETWITSIEYRQLQSEGWRITCYEYVGWLGAFSMREYVDKLETLRTKAEGGPSGPIGTMVKATGNHSYGKTVEHVEPIEYVLADECPDDCLPYYDNGPEPLAHIFYRMDPNRGAKDYHQPQLGAFITAHVRMVLRRAILCAPDAWLYADTDCVVFSRDVTASLDIDAKRYGAWKVEDAGTVYRIIAKKVYAQVESAEIYGGPPNPKLKRSSKGMNVKRLSADDFARWFEGGEPVQDQIQINNFLAVLCGAEMYRTQRRKGTRVETVTTDVLETR